MGLMSAKGTIDLHSHTVASDGVLTSEQLIRRAANLGLKALAITDHDTTNAHTPTAGALAGLLKLELVSGIEISTRDADNNKYHILGLLIDLHCPELLKLTHDVELERKRIAIEHIDLLQKHGWEIDLQDLNFKGVIVKTHIADAVIQNPKNKQKLIDEFGKVPTQGQFIESWLIKGKPADVSQRNSISPQEAIDVIHKAKGIAILAHPSFNIMLGADPETLCKEFLAMGIDGFEAIYLQMDRSDNDKVIEHRDFLTAFAAKHELVISGGSDYHTSDITTFGKVVELGFSNKDWKVEYDILQKLKDRQKLLFGTDSKTYNKQFFDGLSSVSIQITPEKEDWKCDVTSGSKTETIEPEFTSKFVVELFRYIGKSRDRHMTIRKEKTENKIDILIADKGLKIQIMMNNQNKLPKSLLDLIDLI